MLYKAAISNDGATMIKHDSMTDSYDPYYQNITHYYYYLHTNTTKH